MFWPLGDTAERIYRMWCPKIIYVHLVKSGRGVGTPLLDLYFNADALGSHYPKWLSGSSILCQSIQFRLNQAYGKSPIGCLLLLWHGETSSRFWICPETDLADLLRRTNRHTFRCTFTPYFPFHGCPHFTTALWTSKSGAERLFFSVCIHICIYNFSCVSILGNKK